MKRKKVMIVCLSLLLCGLASAAVTIVGDVTPSDPCSWNYYTSGYVGDTNVGTMTMDGGSALEAQYVYIGNSTDSNGTLTMSGGSTLTSYGIYLAMAKATAVGKVVLDGNGTKITVLPDNGKGTTIGRYGTGELELKNGAQVETRTSTLASYLYTGTTLPARGTLRVDGEGSTFYVNGTDPATDFLTVGNSGASGYNVGAYVYVTNGGKVICNTFSGIAYGRYSYAYALVKGAGSSYTTVGDLMVSRNGNGVLVIDDYGLVKVGGALSINLYYARYWGRIEMKNNGQLALKDASHVGDANITAFLGLIDLDGPDGIGVGNTDIRYYNGTAWSNIANATEGVDYTLAAGTGDLADYTVLTVTAIGPCEYDIQGDFDNDCKVDFKDFAKLAGNWLVDCIYPVVDPRCSE